MGAQSEANAQSRKLWLLEFTAPVRGPLSRDQMSALSRLHKQFSQMRLEVIDEAIKIEKYVTTLLMQALMDQNPYRWKIFHDLFLSGEACGLYRKWQLLRDLLHMFPDACAEAGIGSAERKQLLTELKAVVSERNKFAHGQLKLDPTTGKGYIEYFEGTPQRVEMSGESHSAFLKQSKHAAGVLAGLFAYFEKKPLDLSKAEIVV